MASARHASVLFELVTKVDVGAVPAVLLDAIGAVGALDVLAVGLLVDLAAVPDAAAEAVVVAAGVAAAAAVDAPDAPDAEVVADAAAVLPVAALAVVGAVAAVPDPAVEVAVEFALSVVAEVASVLDDPQPLRTEQHARTICKPIEILGTLSTIIHEFPFLPFSERNAGDTRCNGDQPAGCAALNNSCCCHSQTGSVAHALCDECASIGSE